MSTFFTKTRNFNDVVNPNNKEVDNVNGNFISKKVTNLLKAKNIIKFAISKKLNFSKTKANRASRTDFFTLKARLMFFQLRKAFIKA